MRKLLDERADLPFGVRLYQTGRDRFTVEYGKQIKDGLRYAAAAREYGECVFHALACNGDLDAGGIE